MVRKEVFIGRGKMISTNLENQEQSFRHDLKAQIM